MALAYVVPSPPPWPLLALVIDDKRSSVERATRWPGHRNDPLRARSLAQGAYHVKVLELVEGESGSRKSADGMRAILGAKGITPESPVVAY